MRLKKQNGVKRKKDIGRKKIMNITLFEIQLCLIAEILMAGMTGRAGWAELGRAGQSGRQEANISFESLIRKKRTNVHFCCDGKPRINLRHLFRRSGSSIYLRFERRVA